MDRILRAKECQRWDVEPLGQLAGAAIGADDGAGCGQDRHQRTNAVNGKSRDEVSHLLGDGAELIVLARATDQHDGCQGGADEPVEQGRHSLRRPLLVVATTGRRGNQDRQAIADYWRPTCQNGHNRARNSHEGRTCGAP